MELHTLTFDLIQSFPLSQQLLVSPYYLFLTLYPNPIRFQKMEGKA